MVKGKPWTPDTLKAVGGTEEWCHDRYAAYPTLPNGQVSEDREEPTDVLPNEPRVVRGGAFNSPAAALRSAARARQLPSHRDPTIGFRVARTHP